MINNTAEKFLLLIQHPEKHRFVVSNQIKNIGLTGSIVLDLANSENLEVKNGRLIIKSDNSNLSQTHKKILEEIKKSSRTKKIKTWISKFSRNSKEIQKEILLDIESKGLIKMHQKSFLGIKNYNTQLLNTAVRENIICEIRDIVFKDATMPSENSIILGLIGACKMHKIIAKDRNEIKFCKRKLAEIIKSDAIAQGVDKVIKEMQAAIIAAVVSSTIAVNSGSY